jgi:hypothetical protein
MYRIKLSVLLLILISLNLSVPARTLPQIRVSTNKRFLVDQSGRPFFYLADTAWELFHRLNRTEARDYLRKRAAQKFTVIQAVALAEIDGLTVPNMHGDLPFIDKDPARPATTPGNNPANENEYDYWDHVDYIVDEANELGFYVGFLPSWSKWVSRGTAEQRVINQRNAGAYGEFLGKRYGSKGVIWILGGDDTVTGYEKVWIEMSKGITRGVTGGEDHNSLLMTFHPSGGDTSSIWFHNEPWLDFNMVQTGHSEADKSRPWEKITKDYMLTPTKPVVDGEPLYEDHPIGFKNAAQLGFSFDAHIRQRAYWDILSGACGFSYGNHAVWQMYAPGREPRNGPLFYWYEAVDRPGATQMQHLRSLMESRPMLTLVPDQSLVVNALSGSNRIQAARGDGFMFVYTATGNAFTVNLGKISGSNVLAYWYNPRNGSSMSIGSFRNMGTKEFTTQFVGLGSDWVLVLDDASRNFPPPGKTGSQVPPSEKNASISLVTGWNLISLPLEPFDADIAKVVQGIRDSVEIVYAYTGSAYVSYKPGDQSNTLTKMLPGQGYWVYMSRNATLTITGNEASNSISLRSGWNLVGYNRTQSLEPAQAVQSISGKYSAIYDFDSISNSYRVYGPGTVNTLTSFEPGRGYWIYSTADEVIWTLPV